MRPILFKGFQTTLGAPANWDEDKFGKCEGLAIRREHGCIYSCWKPSLKERVKLILGQPITMIVNSPVTQPPIALDVGYPCGEALKP